MLFLLCDYKIHLEAREMGARSGLRIEHRHFRLIRLKPNVLPRSSLIQEGEPDEKKIVRTRTCYGLVECRGKQILFVDWTIDLNIDH